ncbi:MAG TPA: protein kinase [Kofleriaceae bacterium]|nr:protein kinase [Kofleriaceae bacterium]
MLAAGQSIGSYRILQKIGTGGMGAVYVAEHPLIGKKVALKVIHRELAGNREVVQRFFQEAKAVNTIGNEHIVEIHDFGVTPDGDHFYIMEYLEGQTLATVLGREKRVDIMRSLHIGAQIANALAAAHAAGVIHRDLKPDNIMLTRRLGDPDFVKVLDFGLAKMLAAGSAVKTAHGVLLGTPQYMSPEACESKRDIDHRTDIYALGILLFQMMTGKLPFDGESMGEVLVKQVTMLPPAPRGFNPAIPPSVEQVLLRCLAKPVDARFPTMIALRDALLDPEAYLRGSPPIAPARSVAPGEAKVDARTVVANAAAMRGQRHAAADHATRLAQHVPAPGVAPEPWQIAPTMMGDAPSGITARPGSSPASAPRAIGVPPGLAPPSEPKNQTMRIATPVGYSSRPPRKMWPVVLVLGLIFGLGGGAFAVAWCGGGRKPAGVTAAASDAGSSTVAVPADPPRDAAPPRPIVDAAIAHAPHADARPAAPEQALLTIESRPAGATVYGQDGQPIGKTPLVLDVLMSNKPMTFELRLAGYRKKTKQVTVKGNLTVGVELERLPASSGTGKGSGTHPGRGSGSSDTALERPGD